MQVYEKLDGEKIFITQRGHGAFKGRWEFPGGKIEEGEMPKEALVREIREELLTKIEYDYPDFHLSMDCFICKIERGNLVLKEKLYDIEWLPADREIIEKLFRYLETLEK